MKKNKNTTAFMLAFTRSELPANFRDYLTRLTNNYEEFKTEYDQNLKTDGSLATPHMVSALARACMDLHDSMNDFAMLFAKFQMAHHGAKTELEKRRDA